MKRIVVCADGTWNSPDNMDRGKRKPTNVVKIARGILPAAADGTPQVVCYHDGVGTNWGIDRIAGGGMGAGLSANIVEAYQFITLNYEPGDEVFLFGFSRGAYTVRSLAGLLHKLGLLPKNHAYYTPEGYALYHDHAGPDALSAFRKAHHSRDLPIKFIGVWDTVGALGIPVGLFKHFNRRYQFHEVTLTRNIEAAYHALAIDEQRRPFAPTLWELPEGSSQILEQVWFPGVHSNIGGGYRKDGLANIALHWLADKAGEHGLEFDQAFLGKYRPWFGHELRDSASFMYKLLRLKPRVIGTTQRGNESVHPLAIRRLEEIPGYHPTNLIDYLENNDPVRPQTAL